MAQQNPSTKWLEDRHNSGVFLSSGSIEVITLPLQAELDSATNSDPSIAAYADFFMLDSFKDSDSWAVDLTYSSIHGRLRKFVDFWHTLEVLQFISNVIMQGCKIPFFWEKKIHLLVSPISLTRFQFLTFVRESKGLFWIFDMSNSLYTSRSLNSKILGIATQLFDRNYYLKQLLFRILAMGFQNIFSSVCSLQLHIFLHQFWSHYRNSGGARASLWLFPWWQLRRGNTMFLKINCLVVHSDMFMSGFFSKWEKVPLGACPSYHLVGCDSQHYGRDYKNSWLTHWKVKRWPYWATVSSTSPESTCEKSR